LLRTSASRFSPAKNTVASGSSVAVPCSPRDTLVMPSRFIDNCPDPRSTSAGSSIWKKCPSRSSNVHGLSSITHGPPRLTPWPMRTLPSGSSTALVVASRLEDAADVAPSWNRIGELDDFDRRRVSTREMLY
jgi:hypothetical protein